MSCEKSDKNNKYQNISQGILKEISVKKIFFKVDSFRTN